MLSFPNNYTRGGEESLKYTNSSSTVALSSNAFANNLRINTDKIKTANISMNSSMAQKFMDTDVIAITNNDNRIKMSQQFIGDTKNDYGNLNMYNGNDNKNNTLYWDYENPFQIPGGILKTVNRYNRVYETPVNNLLNIGYDNGEDTALQNDSSSYAIEWQGTKTVVVSSIFNPTHMMQVNGLTDNIPIMDLNEDFSGQTEVYIGDSYTLGVSEDARSQRANGVWDQTHKKGKTQTSLIDKYLSAAQKDDGKNPALYVKWDDKNKDGTTKDGVEHTGSVFARVDYSPFDITKHTSNTSNCTVRELVKLSHGRNTIIGQARYKYADFLFCKDFGKVSNNHMITLRRFAHPVGDNIFRFSGKKYRNREDYGNNDFQENSSHGTLITWFGTDDNKLEDILKYSVKSTWKEFKSKIKEIDSQEDNDANGIIGMLANSFSPAYNSLVARGMAGANSIWGHWGSRLIGGVMGRMHLPTAGGATNANSMRRWDAMRMGADENRIYTPKNTIQATHKYEGELVLSHEFTLNFSYKLRAFDLMNPKTVMLDLIGNILEVTYNRGHFWGGENRIIGPPRNSQGVRNINAFIDRQWDKLEGFMMGFANGTLDWKGILGSLSDLVNSAINAIKGAAEATISSKGQNIVEVAQKLTGQFVRSGASKAMLGQLKNALGRPAVYCMNSLLDGSPVGLWHITIGNPKNPIAAFGNLIMTNATIQHSGPLGFDDFPTDIKVTVSLKHGRSRDLSEVARMYTKGTGSFYSAVDKNKLSEFFSVSNTATGAQLESKLDDLHISQKFTERFTILKGELESLEKQLGEAKKKAEEERKKADEEKKKQEEEAKQQAATTEDPKPTTDGKTKGETSSPSKTWEWNGKEWVKKSSSSTTATTTTTTTTTTSENKPAGTSTQEDAAKTAEQQVADIQGKITKNKKEMENIRREAARMGIDVDHPLTMEQAFPYTANEAARLDNEDDYNSTDPDWRDFGHFITNETALRYETLGQDRDIEGRILIDEMS